MMALGAVVGPTATQEAYPETATKWVLLPSITLGMEIAFRRTHGTRY
jgi:hypothetical protein